ncbi:MAG: Cell differentiation protein RCD1 [Marteilia pararefringens]
MSAASEGASNSQHIESLTATDLSDELEEVHSLLRIILKGPIGIQIDSAIIEIAKKREKIPNLALIIWNTPGIMTVLLLKLIKVYSLLNPPTLNREESSSVCNTLGLLQLLATHPVTKIHLIQANFPLYLYPFLNTVSPSKNFEYLRLTSMGVIGALVKVDDPRVISFLLQSEMTPICLRIMEIGTDLSKTVSTFILLKILADQNGLAYVCKVRERYMHVIDTLRKLLDQNFTSSHRLILHILKCCIYLISSEVIQNEFKNFLPNVLQNLYSHLDAKDPKNEEIIEIIILLFNKINK